MRAPGLGVVVCEVPAWGFEVAANPRPQFPNPHPLATPTAKFSQSDESYSDRTSGGVVGSILVIQGSILIYYAQRRYEDVATKLEAGDYAINTGGLNMILGMIVCTSIVSLGIIIALGVD